MSAGGQSRDLVWAHRKETGKPGQNICNYCQEVVSGGPYRMKFHLARISGQNVRLCTNVDIDVQRQINAYLESMQQKKDAKKRSQHEMARPSMPTPPMPSPPMTSPLVHEEGSASVGASDSRTRQPWPPSISVSGGTTSAVRCDFFAPRGGQTTLDSAWNKDKFKEARKAVGNFWYYSDIPFNAANSPYWEYMVHAIACCGPSFKAPTFHDLRGPILEEAVEDIKKIIDEQRKIWRRKGCSILSDGWTDRRGRSLLNFLVSSSGGLVFLKSVDASAHIKNAEYLFSILQEVIEDVGVENVVQVNFQSILFWFILCMLLFLKLFLDLTF